MGLMKKSKVTSIGEDAKRAAAQGRTSFVARYWDEMLAFQGTGAISGASEAIEAVEEAGWSLAHVAYSWVEKKNRGLTILVFRLKPPKPPADNGNLASLQEETVP